jgi:hypothetical protein
MKWATISWKWPSGEDQGEYFLKEREIGRRSKQEESLLNFQLSAKRIMKIT